MVPVGFYQCLIIMIYDYMSEEYFPVFYILLDCKLQKVYEIALEHVKRAAPKLKLTTVTADFEIGLDNALMLAFVGVVFIGCLFHWKQAVRRRLIAIGFSKDTVTFMIGENGVMNLLTTVDPAEIREGIRYCRSKVDEVSEQSKWDSFWGEYFWDTWCVRYSISDWNVFAIH